jgi:hypothetical protein
MALRMGVSRTTLNTLENTGKGSVTSCITRDEREVQKAFERAVFNVLFHNRDDHAKNLTYRWRPKGIGSWPHVQRRPAW